MSASGGGRGTTRKGDVLIVKGVGKDPAHGGGAGRASRTVIAGPKPTPASTTVDPLANLTAEQVGELALSADVSDRARIKMIEHPDCPKHVIEDIATGDHPWDVRYAAMQLTEPGQTYMRATGDTSIGAPAFEAASRRQLKFCDTAAPVGRDGWVDLRASNNEIENLAWEYRGHDMSDSGLSHITALNMADFTGGQTAVMCTGVNGVRIVQGTVTKADGGKFSISGAHGVITVSTGHVLDAHTGSGAGQAAGLFNVQAVAALRVSRETKARRVLVERLNESSSA
jgi:hypothetical protein